jgi:hypothetical protein
MGSIMIRGRKLYAKLKAVNGEWQRHATGQYNTPNGWRAAERWLANLEREVADARARQTREGLNWKDNAVEIVNRAMGRY